MQEVLHLLCLVIGIDSCCFGQGGGQAPASMFASLGQFLAARINRRVPQAGVSLLPE